MSTQAEQPMETLKSSIERRLADRAAADSSFIAELMLNPDAILKPLITESLGDDGEVNLADVSTSVHIETGRNLHFVVTVSSGDVQGFGAFDLAASLGSFGDPMAGEADALFGRKTKRRCDTEPADEVTPLCSRHDLGCPTVYPDPRGPGF